MEHRPAGRLVFALTLALLLLAVAGVVFLRMPGLRRPDPQPQTQAPTPAAEPSREPAAEPTPVPTVESAAEPSPEPSPESTPEPTPAPPPAEQVPIRVLNRGQELEALTDGSYLTVQSIFRGDTVTVEAQAEIAALYIQWEEPPEPWTLRCGEREEERGSLGFLHEYVPLPEPTSRVELRMPPDADLSFAEIYALSPGERPDWVQDWQQPWEQADLLVVATHSDDEFVFLGGLIPKYVDEGRRVQLAYIVRHTGFRRHEMLDSLWEAGVDHYPVTSHCADVYEKKLSKVREVYGTDYMIGYLVEQIRRFKPQVLVGQAEDGDSGHPVHVFGVDCLECALDLAETSGSYPESEARYGLHRVPKMYLHLYGEQEEMVTLDYDRPLARFGGATAFDVARRAFLRCVSQYEAGRYEVYGPDSVHDSRRFGLYRSLVGPDERRDDLFEHLDEPFRAEK